MNPDPDQDLALQVDRMLKALPELQAPVALSRRVMAAIRAREALPWHRQAWSTWSVAAQTVALLLLASLFAGICLGAYKLPDVAAVAALKHQLLTFLSVISATWAAPSALVNAAVRAVQNLGTGPLIGCAAAAILGYLMCVGLGTVYVRLAMARR
jgi:hypothetical protein